LEREARETLTLRGRLGFAGLATIEMHLFIGASAFQFIKKLHSEPRISEIPESTFEQQRRLKLRQPSARALDRLNASPSPCGD
jgi:hypothetical protein